MSLNYLVAAAAILLITGAKPVRSRTTIHEDYFSPEQNVMLRGFFAVFIIFHHMAQFNITPTAHGNLFLSLGYCGYLPLSVFFFWSGFGLMKKHVSDPLYRRHFLLQRIPTLLIPYLLATLIYWCVYAIGRNCRYGILEILHMTFLEGNPLAVFSWYVISIILFYLMFWVLMCIFRQHYCLMLIAASIFYIAYSLLCARIGYGMWWYYASYPFIFGMLWAWRQKWIDSFVKRWYIPCLIISCLSFCVIFRLLDYLFLVIPFLSIIAVFSILCCSFTASVSLLTMKLKIGNPVLHFLGQHSFSIYLMHGIYVSVLYPYLTHISDDLLRGVCIILLSIGTAYVFQKLSDWILKRYKRWLANYI